MNQTKQLGRKNILHDEKHYKQIEVLRLLVVVCTSSLLRRSHLLFRPSFAQEFPLS
jgi:hypothetical protein